MSNTLVQMSDGPSITKVRDYFLALQTQVCTALEEIDGKSVFSLESIETAGGGLAQPRIIDDGRYLERGAVQFSHSFGDSLPPAASERNPDLAGRGFEATAISMIMHPVNPYVPTFHANLRFFLIDDQHWHFGGGFDLTPYYPFPEDVLHWHQISKAACDPFEI